MEYFYIMSSAASLAGFVGFLFILYRDRKGPPRHLATYLCSFFLILTVLFWLWFYIGSGNKEADAIRSVLVKTYADRENYIDIVQGQIEFSTFEPRSVFLPPFRSKPVITFGREKGVAPYDPILIEVTQDRFIVKVDNSVQLGRWDYRARGELLRKVE